VRVVYRALTRFSRFALGTTAESLLIFPVLMLVAGLSAAVSRADLPLPRSVLILDQSDPHSAWYTGFSQAFRSTLHAGSSTQISLYAEHLDLSRFGDLRHEELLRTYLRDKFRERMIGVLVAQGSAALDFVLRSRQALWAGVPVVFAGVHEAIGKRSNFPSDVTGTLYHQPFRNTVTTARALVPNLKRIALVGDAWDRQAVRRHYKDETPEFGSEFEFIDLFGLPMTEIRKRVAALPVDTAIIYTSVTLDGAGTTYIPNEALAAFADFANRPIVIDVETNLGHGGTGGFVATPALAGRAAAQLALQILEGEKASNIPITTSDFTRPVFDWRQLQRFGISEKQLPLGSEIRFRPPSLWEQYRWYVMAVVSAFLLQAAMIGRLLFEHRRRRMVEGELRRRLLEVIHLNRTATAGALSASVAHELNQPLGAIQSSAEAAELYLKVDPPNIDRVAQLLANIRRDDQRAADIIHHLRRLLKKKDAIELQEFDVNEVIQDALDILRPEASKRGVKLDAQCARTRLPVRADRIQLQQVILNLAINGLDAMQNSSLGCARMSIRAEAIGESAIEVLVADSGTGIPDDKLGEIFNAFYTTKRQGTGLGLSIARTIVETYGGKIWAENSTGGGAVFRFILPSSRAIAHDEPAATHSYS
jgi:signal transduction histidine kinase